MGSASIHVDASNSVVPPATQAELRAKGKKLREKCPRGSHANWKAPFDRRDPVDLIEDANIGRLPALRTQHRRASHAAHLQISSSSTARRSSDQSQLGSALLKLVSNLLSVLMGRAVRSRVRGKVACPWHSGPTLIT